MAEEPPAQEETAVAAEVDGTTGAPTFAFAQSADEYAVGVLGGSGPAATVNTMLAVPCR
ncbi:MAG: hypothetical protein M1118_05205 [Chloroflexi bacterium]|nr:hypothetical protein [Chloroflexota bacterium]